MKQPQIFLLHYAGGHAHSYDFFGKSIRNAVSHALELPGRGKRFQEEFLPNRAMAAEDYVAQIRQKRNGQPYVLYGHSMGASLGLEVCRLLEEAGDAPRNLVVSGNPGPGVKEPRRKKKGKVFLLSDNDFKEELRELGGTPPEVLDNEELYSFFSPILRADYKILEIDEDVSEKEITIRTPIFAIMGSDEETSSQIENWRRFTTGNFQFEILPGGHFFIFDHPATLAGILQRCFDNNLHRI